RCPRSPFIAASAGRSLIPSCRLPMIGPVMRMIALRVRHWRSAAERASGLLDDIFEGALALGHLLETIAADVAEMPEVDDGGRVGRDNMQTLAPAKRGHGLFRAQDRQRALQAGSVEKMQLVRHCA